MTGKFESAPPAPAHAAPIERAPETVRAKVAIELVDASVPAALPPGPRASALRQGLAWVFRPVPFMTRSRAHYGQVFCARLGPGQSVVFLSDPELVEATLTGDPELLRTGDINGIFRSVIGPDGILMLDGEEHLRRRRLLLPPFHGESLERCRSTMVEIAERKVAEWPTGVPFPVLPRMHEISSEIIARAVFGVRDERLLAGLREALPRFLERCRTPAFLIPALRRRLGGLSAWSRLMRSVHDLDAILLEEIGARRSEKDLDTRPDVLSLLVRTRDEDGVALSDSEIRDELMTLLVAGHETTSGALALAIEQIVQHPGILDRLEAAIAAEDESYLDAVVRESLRRRPVLPIVGRKLAAPARLRDWVLPKGTVLMPCAYLLHHEPGVYPYPDEFRPERFIESPPGAYDWIPFGGGTRRCIGASFATLEMKVVLRTVFERLSLRAAGDPEPPVRRSVSLAPRRGARVIAEPFRGGFAA